MNDLFKTALENLSEGCQILDFNYKYLYLNPVAIKQSQRPVEEFLGKTMKDVYPEIGNTEMFRQIKRCLESRKPITFETKLELPDKSNVWLKFSLSPNPYGVLILSNDISESKINEEKLRELTEFQNIILNGTEYSIISTDKNGIIKTFNKGAELLLGYSSEELVGKFTPAMFHDNDEIKLRSETLSKELEMSIAPNFETFVAKSRFGKADTNLWTYIRKDKRKILVELSITTLKNKENEITGFLGIAKDITETEKSKIELVKAKEQAEAANIAKSEFLTNMSHEIRTPLNGVIGFVEILMKTILNESQRRFLETVQNSALFLQELIDDLLDLTEISNGKLELINEPIEIRGFLKKIIGLVSMRDKASNIRLEIFLGEKIPKNIWSDSIRLRRILLNLLNNAVKFTEKGTIEIKLEILEEDKKAGINKFRFTVTDSGIGISDENQKRIFNTFSQVDASTKRKYGGAGIGLNISNKLLGIMGSKLELESKLGEGSRFYFTIESRMGNEQANSSLELSTPEKGQLSEGSYRILAIDDSSTNLFLIKTILSQILLNSEILTANSGLAGIELVKETPIDLILLDVQMPELNGYETTIEIRKLEKTRRIPIIAVTAGTIKGEHQKCLDSGMDDFITKPIVREIIESILLKWLPGEVETTEQFLPIPKISESKIHFNKEKLIKTLEGDLDFMRTLLLKGTEDITLDLQSLKQRFKDNNLESMKSSTHRLKGIALTLCFERLGYIAEELETKVEEDGYPIQEIIKAMEEEVAEIGKLVEELIGK